MDRNELKTEAGVIRDTFFPEIRHDAYMAFAEAYPLSFAMQELES